MPPSACSGLVPNFSKYKRDTGGDVRGFVENCTSPNPSDKVKPLARDKSQTSPLYLKLNLQARFLSGGGCGRGGGGVVDLWESHGTIGFSHNSKHKAHISPVT